MGIFYQRMITLSIPSYRCLAPILYLGEFGKIEAQFCLQGFNGKGCIKGADRIAIQSGIIYHTVCLDAGCRRFVLDDYVATFGTWRDLTEAFGKKGSDATGYNGIGTTRFMRDDTSNLFGGINTFGKAR